MPFSDPSPGNRAYRATLRSVAQVGGAPLVVNCTFESESIDADAMGPVFQAFIDLVAASSDFTVQTAARARTHTENVTPSP